MPENELDRILTEAVQAAEVANLKNDASNIGSSSGMTQERTDGPRKISIHNHHIRDSYQHLDWKRPCLKGFEVAVFSDSSARAFGRQEVELPGYCIVAYGSVLKYLMNSYIRCILNITMS